jgi:hypothetical protein
VFIIFSCVRFHERLMGRIRNAAALFGAGVLAALFARRASNRAEPLSRRERLRQAYLEAENDPAYQAEMAAIDRAFDGTVADGLERRSLADA